MVSGGEADFPVGRSPEPAAEREIVIERVFDAPARLLFAAFSGPEHVMRWFGPKGYPLTLCEMDFRVGGRYRFAMTGPDGTQMPPFGGAYLEIIPGERIVYSSRAEWPGAEEMVVTVTFVEERGRTTLTLRTLFASIAMKEKHVARGYAEGVGSGLDQLAGVVDEMARA
jgi:uncharacterized protein YndB with AHSA1/START domain